MLIGVEIHNMICLPVLSYVRWFVCSLKNERESHKVSDHFHGGLCTLTFLESGCLITLNLDWFMLKEVANDNYRVASWCTGLNFYSFDCATWDFASLFQTCWSFPPSNLRNNELFIQRGEWRNANELIIFLVAMKFNPCNQKENIDILMTLFFPFKASFGLNILWTLLVSQTWYRKIYENSLFFLLFYWEIILSIEWFSLMQ